MVRYRLASTEDDAMEFGLGWGLHNHVSLGEGRDSRT